jgi:hypothetical protein
MKKLICTVSKPCYHPATAMELRPGKIEVTDEEAKTLIAAGMAKPVGDKVEVKPAKPKGERDGQG